jgi:hypothetical protein
MPHCPNCGHAVHLPYFMYLSGLRWCLTCPHCNSALETIRPRSAALIASVALVFPLMLIGPKVILFRLAAIAVIVVAAAVVLFESFHPKLQLRKRLPKPEVLLKI